MGSRIPFGTMFGGTLVVSWIVATALVGLAMWSDRGTSAVRLATWGSLWIFTVVSPTLNALAVHRSLAALRQADGDTGTLEQLARLRSVLLLSANMALLSAFGLILGR